MTRQRSRVSGWAIAAVVAFIAIILYAVRYALLPFVFSGAIGFVLNPLITGAQRRTGLSRGLVAGVVFVALVVVLAFPGYFVMRATITDLSDLIAHGPERIHRLVEEAIGPSGANAFGQNFTADSLTRSLLQAIDRVLDLGGLAPIAKFGVSTILAISLTFVLTPYVMISGPRLVEGGIWLFPPERRSFIRELLPKIVPALRRYLIGVLAVVLYTSSVAWIAFGPVFHLPHGLLLAMAVGVLELIPVLGPILAIVMIWTLALQESSLWMTVVLAVFAVALRLSIDNLVGPLVLGRAARVPAVVVMFAFVCGGVLFGIVGLLLAVPIVSCIKITLSHYYAEPIRGDQEARR